MLKSILQLQVRASKAFDKLFPSEMRIDGGYTFRKQLAPSMLKQGMRVFDVGSGRFPCYSVEQKDSLELNVVGLDIVEEELLSAPMGAYDEAVVADITQYRGAGTADLVVSHAVLEHVRDTAGALRAITSIVKPGGSVAIFVPSRNAVFARLNLILPEAFKRWLLNTFKTGYSGDAGWPAHYDRCTPKEFRLMAMENGLEVIELKPFFTTSYFRAIFPAFVIWRIWTVLFRLICGENAAESFFICLQKPAEPSRLGGSGRPG